MPVVTERIADTTPVQSRDKTVRATFDDAAGFHIRVKPGSVSTHSAASLAAALQEAASRAFRGFHSPDMATADPQWDELLAKIADLRAVATGPREGIRVTWQKSTPLVAVRGVILEWEALEVAAEATAVINRAYQRYGEEVTSLIEADLDIRGDRR